MVVSQSARITLAGVVVGLVAAFFLTRLLGSLVFGLGTVDVPTFAAMSAVMVAVALLASYVPARRASSVDPMQSLRTE
jgi:ABC-type antimicrobial peptide transport system permease subunit